MEIDFAALYGCAILETVVPAAPGSAATCWDSFYGGSVSVAAVEPGKCRRDSRLTFEMIDEESFERIDGPPPHGEEDKPTSLQEEEKLATLQDEDGEPALPFSLHSAQPESMFFTFTVCASLLHAARVFLAVILACVFSRVLFTCRQPLLPSYKFLTLLGRLPRHS